MSNYSIHCVGFDRKQQESITAVLDLADFALEHAWAIIDSSDSDIVMVKAATEKGQQFLVKYNNLVEYRIILVAENFQESFQKYWFLEKKDHSPPSLRVLADLLNQIDVYLVEAAVTERADKQEERLASSKIDDAQEQVAESLMLDSQNDIKQQDDLTQLIDEGGGVNIKIASEANHLKYENLNNTHRKFLKKNYFFGLLLQVYKEKKFSIVKFRGLPALYLAPEDNSYFFSGNEAELLQYCLVPPLKLNVKIFSKAKFKKALKAEVNKLTAKKFKFLICYAIIQVSQGQLLEGHSAKQPFKLKSISIIEEDSMLDRYKEIAELMYQQEGSLFDIAEKLKTPLSHVFDFYNVCYLLSYINRVGIESEGLDTDNSKTIGQYFKNFFLK